MKKPKKTHTRLANNRFAVVSMATLFAVAVACVITALSLKADTATTVSFQAENGTKTGVNTISDASAAGGSSIKFGVGGTGLSGRSYPWHTNINATTFWVGEQFQPTPDGSQICSAYDGAWQFSHFGVKVGETVTKNCNNPYPAKCDAVKTNPNGACSDGNVTKSIYLPENDYQPVGGPASIENPFYLDLPYNDYGENGADGYITGSETRCQDIPWANDPGYAGKCNADFSYMKNRWVHMTAVGGKVCYGQIEDAGPADIGNGNPNYADRAYVFGSNDARPFNKSYGNAGADVSPALNACLGGRFNETVIMNWRFVDEVDVPAGPWTRTITRSGVNW